MDKKTKLVKNEPTGTPFQANAHVKEDYPPVLFCKLGLNYKMPNFDTSTTSFRSMVEDNVIVVIVFLQLCVVGLAFVVGYFLGAKKNSVYSGNETVPESSSHAATNDVNEDDIHISPQPQRRIRDRELALHRVDKYEHLIERAKRSLLNIIGVCSHTEAGWKDLNKHLKDAHKSSKGKGSKGSGRKEDNGLNELWVKHDNVGEGIQIKGR